MNQKSDASSVVDVSSLSNPSSGGHHRNVIPFLCKKYDLTREFLKEHDVYEIDLIYLLLILLDNSGKNVAMSLNEASVILDRGSSTAERYLSLLEGRGIVVLHFDKVKMQICSIEMTDSFLEKMNVYLQKVNGLIADCIDARS